MKRALASAIGMGLVVAAIALLRRSETRAPEEPPPAPTLAAATVPTATATANANATATATANATATATATATVLTSPRATVQTQIDLLLAGRDAELRDTFLPAVREQLTPDALAYCKQKVRSHPVRPDWEMAEDGVTDAGLRERRVSMFGKSMTGFVETEPDRWLAGSVWCVQGRLP